MARDLQVLTIAETAPDGAVRAGVVPRSLTRQTCRKPATTTIAPTGAEDTTMGKRAERQARKAEKTATLAPTAEVAEQQAAEAQVLHLPSLTWVDDAAWAAVDDPNAQAAATVEAEPTANAESKAKAEANRKAKAEKAEADLLAKYPHIVEVTERGVNGPTRVKIVCDDPQTKQVVTADGPVQQSVCQLTREIAVQDLFQVRRCAACQDRVIRKGRRARQAKKDKQLRKLAKLAGK